MTQYQLLNSKEHAQLKLISPTEHLPHFAPIVVSEVSAALASCPIMFTKEANTGEFLLVAIFSLKTGELPLKNLPERGGFLPLSMVCKGFAIAGQDIAIDTESSRFSNTQGETLFTESQQPADNLRQVQTALGQYTAGIDATRQFIQTLLEFNLIEPMEINLAFQNHERLSLAGLYTVSLDNLRDLNDSQILSLHKSGYLELTHLIAASRKQFNVLAELRNRSLMDAVAD